MQLDSNLSGVNKIFKLSKYHELIFVIALLFIQIIIQNN